MKTGIIVALLTFSSAAHAGPVADSFRDGLVGLQWGATAAQVEAKLPGGSWVALPGGVRNYTVSDGREFLGIARDPTDQLVFGFTSDGLLGVVSITFNAESSLDVLVNAQRMFGADHKTTASKPPGIATYTTMWPVDGGIHVTLANVFAGGDARRTVLSIDRQLVSFPQTTSL